MRSAPIAGLDREVSRLCLGVMNHGTTTPEEVGHRLLDRFRSAGGTIVDTANNYAFWNPGGTGDESELSLGRWLESRSARDDVVVASKVGARPRAGSSSLQQILGLSASAVIEQVEGSLQRLGTDRIDLLYAHVDDVRTPLEETLEAFTRLLEQGKIRAAAASNVSPGRLAEALAISTRNDLAPYRALQMRHTYLPVRPDADFSESMQVPLTQAHQDLAREQRIRVFTYAALLNGSYTRPDRPVPPQYRTDAEAAATAALRHAAAEHGVSENHVVYAWLLAHGCSPVVGASTERQLEDAIEAEALSLDDETIAALDRARDYQAVSSTGAES